MITDYIVSYTNGSGGHFLISMIERTVLNDNNFAPLKRGKFNDAHYATSVRNFRIDHKSIDPASKNTAEDEFFKASRIVPGKPVFIPTHVYWPSRQFEKWPNAKLAVVLHTEADMIDLAINGFYKTEMTEEWHDLQRNYNKVYFSPHNVVFEQVRKKHPLEFNAEDISYAVRTRVCMSIGGGYHFIKPITDDPRIHYIQYQDLVSNLDKLIEFVTEVTGKTPNDATIAEMIKYQTAQIDNMKRIKLELGL